MTKSTNSRHVDENDMHERHEVMRIFYAWYGVPRSCLYRIPIWFFCSVNLKINIFLATCLPYRPLPRDGCLLGGMLYKSVALNSDISRLTATESWDVGHSTRWLRVGTLASLSPLSHRTTTELCLTKNVSMFGIAQYNCIGCMLWVHVCISYACLHVLCLSVSVCMQVCTCHRLIGQQLFQIPVCMCTCACVNACVYFMHVMLQPQKNEVIFVFNILSTPVFTAHEFESCWIQE